MRQPYLTLAAERRAYRVAEADADCPVLMRYATLDFYATMSLLAAMRIGLNDQDTVVTRVGPVQAEAWKHVPRGLKSLRENWKFPNSVPQGRLSVAQDAVLGRSRNMIQSRKGRLKITGLSAVPYGTVRGQHLLQGPNVRQRYTQPTPAGLSFRTKFSRKL